MNAYKMVHLSILKKARGGGFEPPWAEPIGLAILRRTELGHPRMCSAGPMTIGRANLDVKKVI